MSDRGPAGPAGPKGATGATGEAGETGATGPGASDEILQAALGMTAAITNLRDEIASIKTYGTQNRHLIRVVIVSVVLDIAASMVAIYGLVKANEASAKATHASSTAVVNCRAANIANDGQRKLWDFAFTFPPPANETPAAKATRENQTIRFKTYLDSAFVQQDCSKVGR